MGGPGSGSWYRWDKKTTTEEVHRVDIRWMKKQGLLRPGISSSLSWNRGGEQTGSIRYQVYDNYLRLIYRARSYGDEWQDIYEKVWFQRTPCNYGGERLWFSCPHCHTRVAILYGLGSRFLCRHCYDLPYASQGETYLDRMRRKTEKIRKRLEADDYIDMPIWKKPKGMHWKTFERLCAKESLYHDRYDQAFGDKIIWFANRGVII